MDPEKKATEATEEKIATPADVHLSEDLEAKYQKLEEEKNNYKSAYLKEAAKKKGKTSDGGDDQETDDERLARIVDERLADSQLAEYTRQLNEISQKALKENKELKASLLARKDPPAAIGGHQEGAAVRDTTVTSEQIAHFKAQGKSDQWIETYRKNLAKRTG